jgi:transcriptional regulator with XRE-family HTH domain
MGGARTADPGVDTTERRVYASLMVIGTRLRDLRESKSLTQADIEKRTGLSRPYVSRVENGHTAPSIQTLEKWARALDLPVYMLFYGGEEPPVAPPLEPAGLWGSSGKDAQLLTKFRRAFARMSDANRDLLLTMLRKIEPKKRSARRVRPAA